MWEVEGGVDGLTCSDHTANDTVFDVALNDTRPRLTCQNLAIPDCIDRTVYCTFPPATITYGTKTTPTNPSSSYLAPNGKINAR